MEDSKKQNDRVGRRSLLMAVPGAGIGLSGIVAGCRNAGERSQLSAEKTPSAEVLDGRAEVLETFVLGRPPWKTLDPFLFCVHHKDDYPEGNEAMGPATSLTGRNIGSDFAGKDGWNMYHGAVVPGFPRHPHRGFETITVTRRGYIDHSDSLGATARYGEGDVQWMTAGAGIVHAEMFPLLESAGRNPAELFQIWINLPKADKFANPYFSMFWNSTVPKKTFRDEHGKETRATIVAGSLAELTAPKPPPNSWASRAQADVAIWSLQMAAGARFDLPATAAGVNRTLYFFDGESLDVAEQTFGVGHGIRVKSDAATPLRNGPKASEVLVLQGRPIGEPVVKHGPFVMNTREEIRQAISDYRRTRFGGWPWSGDAPVHTRDEGRFAVHADGRRERGT